MAFMQTQERKRMAMDLAYEFKNKHRGEDVRRLFVSRTAEADFAEIGRAAMPKKKAANVDPHILTWTGFEVLVGSPYLVWQ